MANIELKDKVDRTIAQVDRVFSEVKRQKTVDTNLQTEINTNKTDIATNQTAISTKASQADLTTLTAQVGSNSASLALKADTATVNQQLAGKAERVIVDQNIADLGLLNNAKVRNISGNDVNLPTMTGATDDTKLATWALLNDLLTTKLSVSEYEKIAAESGLIVKNVIDFNQTTAQITAGLPTTGVADKSVYWLTGSDGNAFVRFDIVNNTWNTEVFKNIDDMKADISAIQTAINLPNGSTIDLTKSIADIVAGLPTTNIKDNEVVQIVGNDGVADYKFSAGQSQWFAFSSNVVTTRNVSDPDPLKTQLEILDGLDLTNYKIGDITNVTGVDAQGVVSTLPFIFNGIPKPPQIPPIPPIPTPDQNTYFTQQVPQQTGGGTFKVTDILNLPELDKAQLGFALTGTIPDIVNAGQTKSYFSGTIPSFAELTAFQSGGYKVQLRTHDANTVQKDTFNPAQTKISQIGSKSYPSNMLNISNNLYTGLDKSFYECTDGINFNVKYTFASGKIQHIIYFKNAIIVYLRDSNTTSVHRSTNLGVSFTNVYTFPNGVFVGANAVIEFNNKLHIYTNSNTIITTMYTSIDGINHAVTPSTFDFFAAGTMASAGNVSFVRTNTKIYKSTDDWATKTVIATFSGRDTFAAIIGIGNELLIFKILGNVQSYDITNNSTTTIGQLNSRAASTIYGLSYENNMLLLGGGDWKVYSSLDIGRSFNNIGTLDQPAVDFIARGTDIYATSITSALYNFGENASGSFTTVIDEVYDLGTTQWETPSGAKVLPFAQVLDADHSLVITKL